MLAYRSTLAPPSPLHRDCRGVLCPGLAPTPAIHALPARSLTLHFPTLPRDPCFPPPPPSRPPAPAAAITTEEYFYCNGSTAYCNAVIQSQLDWLQADLSAVDRSVTPWLIVMGHKQGWMDSIGAGNWSAIETILQSNGADMYFTGHTHVSGAWAERGRRVGCAGWQARKQFRHTAASQRPLSAHTLLKGAWHTRARSRAAARG